jgi:hypothetical protein
MQLFVVFNSALSFLAAKFYMEYWNNGKLEYWVLKLEYF